jgi:redox-sensing transcriptional repressor
VRKIAESTVRRLSLYLRFLEEFDADGETTASSAALAARGGTTSAQVRKDLSFFGSFGKRGLGYPIPALIARLREILGLNRRYRVIVIGAGKIGSALVQYHGFKERGFDLAALYDNDPKKVGREWAGVTVRDVSQLERDLHRKSADIAAIVTPAEAAQEIADTLVSCGVSAILNFAPVQVTVPETVAVKTVNLVLELEALSYALGARG